MMDHLQNKEAILRELNLYPLWQLREPVTVSEAELEKSLQSVSLEKPVSIEKPVSVEQLGSLEKTEETRSHYSEIEAEEKQPDCSEFSWDELKKQVRSCTACHLRGNCMQTVFGMGDEKADWLFVGAVPNADDDQQGQPFAGAAGELLDNMLAAIQLKRGKNVYLTNVLKCSASALSIPSNEAAKCLPYLQRQIALLQPKVIVAMGREAANMLLGEERVWESLSGHLHEYVMTSQNGSEQKFALLVTHHPSVLLQSPMEKAQTWRDLCMAKDVMQSVLKGWGID